MNRPTLFVLIALNTLFVGVLAVEWMSATEIPAATPAQILNSESDEPPPSFDLTEPSEDSYSDLVERPLFIKGRKPVNEPVPESVPVAAVKKVDVFVWELTGIFTSPKGVTAFFSRTNAKVEKDNHRKIQYNEELDGWKVSEIHTDHVVLMQSGEIKTLPLRKMKPKLPIPVAMTANNRAAPPPPQKPVPVTTAQEMQLNNTPPEAVHNAPQNIETESATVEDVNPENP